MSYELTKQDDTYYSRLTYELHFIIILSEVVSYQYLQLLYI